MPAAWQDANGKAKIMAPYTLTTNVVIDDSTNFIFVFWKKTIFFSNEHFSYVVDCIIPHL